MGWRQSSRFSKNEKKIFEIGEAAKLRNFAPPPLAHKNIDGGAGEVVTLARRNKFSEKKNDGKRFSACLREI